MSQGGNSNMFKTLEVRKSNLISQIEKLKKEIEILRYPGYEKLNVCYRTSNVEYLSLDILKEN